LRQSVREADVPPAPPPPLSMPDSLDTLAHLEQRIRGKLETQRELAHDLDVGVEPLLLEVQVYDGVFAEAIQPAKVM